MKGIISSKLCYLVRFVDLFKLSASCTYLAAITSPDTLLINILHLEGLKLFNFFFSPIYLFPIIVVVCS